VTAWPAADVASTFAALPIIESPFLPHGTVLSTPTVLMVGTERIDRAERIRRAARHEARLIARARARDLGYDAPDPTPTFGPHLPTDELMVRWQPDTGPARWLWPDLDAELSGRRAELIDLEEARRDREWEVALQEWVTYPFYREPDEFVVATDDGIATLNGGRPLARRPFPRHSSAAR